MTKRMVDTDDLVSISDIGYRGGVTKQAVSNWIARHEDFPKHVAAFGGGKFKIYLWSEVEPWLREHGITPRTITAVAPLLRRIRDGEASWDELQAAGIDLDGP